MISSLPKKSFFGASIGTMVENYDYVLFGMLLPILAPLFFPADTVYQSLGKSYFILLLTTLARPFGAVFFGYIGDMFGRRKALLASMYGIALATIMIGLTPNYATLGVAAVAIITIAKSIQLFCFGGEFNGAGIYVVEHAQNRHEATVSSFLAAMTLSGAFIATLCGIIVTSQFMPDWGWRAAFIFGGLAGIVGISYRKNLLETPNFINADTQSQSFTNLVKQHPKELIAGMFVGGFVTTPFTTVTIFIMPVLMSKGYFTLHQVMLAQTLLMAVAVATLVSVGFISTKLSSKLVMKSACIMMAIFAYPLLYVIDIGSTLGILLSLAAIITLNEIFLGPANAYLKNLFIMQYRYRGSSLGFCVGMSVFGGLTPIIENFLYSVSGHFSAIALWLAFVGIGAVISMNLEAKESSA